MAIASPTVTGVQKKVLWFDGIKPPTQITTSDLQNAAQTFDGFVVQRVVGSQDNAAVGENFAWDAFSTKQYAVDQTRPDYVGDSLTALQNLPPQLLPNRFLRVNTSPFPGSSFDWLSDSFWANVSQNMRVAGQIASRAHLTGIFLDTEPYTRAGLPNQYNFNSLRLTPKYAGMTYGQLAAIVEQRGRQIIEAVNSEDPSLKIIVSFGYITVSQHVRRANLPSNGSLIVPLLDGMLDGSTPTTTFVDGCEQSYWHDNSPGYFSAWHNAMSNPMLYNVRFQKYRAKFLAQYQVGFGLFLDRNRGLPGDLTAYGWCGDTRSLMYYSTDRLAYTVQQAGAATDEYVWVYGGKPNAWLDANSQAPGLVPQAYRLAVRNGISRANSPLLAPLPQVTTSAIESDACGTINGGGTGWTGDAGDTGD